jgi:hypothetical protein
MPLTEKGNEIKSNMEKEYGPKKGEEVFYASKNKGNISGVDAKDVTKPDQPVPPTHTAPAPLKPVDPMTPVAGFAGARSGPAVGDGSFKLPETVSTQSMKEAGRKYGNSW